MSEQRLPRVLVADDQAANARILAEALKDEFDVSVATDGAKVLALAERGDLDLILLDVVMPGMDGFEVCRRLKADRVTAAVPVIFVTSLEEVEDETRGFELGAVDYIMKPIRPAVVRARVRMHLELTRARDLLARLASIDPLTGLANRRRLESTLDEEWNRALAAGSSFSFAIVDVDLFKQFNDTYGHVRGDECLRSVAGALVGAIRGPGDLAARYGGEEFALVLPATDSKAMRAVAERLLERVGHLAIPHATSSCSDRVSVSIGAVSVVPSTEQTATGIIECADRLLYEAKAGGRNQCVHLDAGGDETTRLAAPRDAQQEGVST